MVHRMKDKDSLKKRSEYQRKWTAKTKAHVAACRKARREGPLRDRILAQRRASYQKTREHVLKYQQWYRGTHKKKISDRERARRNKNPELTKTKKAEEYKRNKSRYRISSARWKLANPNWFREWTNKNRNEVRRKARLYGRTRRSNDPHFRAAATQRSRIWSLIKKSGRIKAFSLGLDKDRLMHRLESLFVSGMTWENYGKKWHIDHIIPCTAFDLTNDAELKKCFHYSNLQPLWAADNLKKHAKIPSSEELAKHGLTLPPNAQHKNP